MALSAGCFGKNASAVPWHVTMLALHLLNCVLVWRLLARVPIATEARFLAAVSFAATTVFHECIYWWPHPPSPSRSRASWPPPISSMAKDRRWWHLPAGASLASAAAFSASYGLIAPLLVPLLCHACAEDAIRARSVRQGALVSLAGLLPVCGRDPGQQRGLQRPRRFRREYVRSHWRPRSDRAVDRRAAGRTLLHGGQLPAPLAWLLMALVGIAAIRRSVRDAALRRVVWASLVWLFASTWFVLSFRTWLGDVVFVSRYQLYPTVAFTLLLAVALDEALSVVPVRSVPVTLAALAIVLVDAGAGFVVWHRWMARTHPLALAQSGITSNLDRLVKAAPAATLTLRDYAIGGGAGYRPRLRGMLSYAAPSLATGHSTSPATPARHSIRVCGPRWQKLRSGAGSWLEWFDDLAVCYRSPPAEARRITAAAAFEQARAGDLSRPWRRRGGSHPPGTGRPPTLSETLSALRGGSGVVWVYVSSARPGELLLRIAAASDDDRRGARLATTPEGRWAAIDIALACRGHVPSQGRVVVDFVDELTDYKVGPSPSGTGEWRNPCE